MGARASARGGRESARQRAFFERFKCVRARIRARARRRRRWRRRKARDVDARGMFRDVWARGCGNWGDDDGGGGDVDEAEGRAAVEALRREAMNARARMDEMRRAARREVKSVGTTQAAVESRRRREEAKTFDPRAASRRGYGEARTTTTEWTRVSGCGDALDDDDQGGREESFEAYEERWCAFESSDARVAARDIPWPRSGAWLLRALERALPSHDDPKRAHRTLAKRWHPDKFIQRFGARVDAREREAIELRVKAVYQSAQELWDACSKR